VVLSPIGRDVVSVIILRARATRTSSSLLYEMFPLLRVHARQMIEST
jgi:hypothetical protein